MYSTAMIIINPPHIASVMVDHPSSINVKKIIFILYRFTIARKMKFVCTSLCCLRSPSKREFLTLPKQTSLLHILWNPKLQPATSCSQLPLKSVGPWHLKPGSSSAAFSCSSFVYFSVYTSSIQMLESHDLSSDTTHRKFITNKN